MQIDRETVLAAAHRTAWRYKKSTDPHHSDTYTFNQATLLQFAQAIRNHRPEGAPAVPKAQALPCAIKDAPSDHAGAAPSLETGPAQASGFADCCLPPPDAIAVNLMVHAGLNKHKARECEQIVRQLLVYRWTPPVATSDTTAPCVANSANGVHEPNFPSGK